MSNIDQRQVLKTHIIFCCNWQCKYREIYNLISIIGEKVIFKGDSELLCKEDRYLFIVDVNKNPERIFGLLITDYRRCEHYLVHKRVLQYCDTHIQQ